MAISLFSRKLSLGTFETFAERPPSTFYQVKQIHCPKIIEVKPKMKASEVAQVKADGLAYFYQDWEGKFPQLGIVTADCMPIALVGKKGACFIHAGWKGLAQGICQQQIQQQLEIHHAFIGPSIGPCCYEVGPDFQNYFPHSPFLQCRKEKYYFDLISEAKRILQLTFTGIEVETTGLCTFCNNSFHSYRRDHTELRNWNLWHH